MSAPDLSLLRRVPYFARLPDAVLDALAAAAIERCLDRGQLIFLEGDPSSGLHVIAEGQIKIFQLSPQGREQVIHRLGPGETFNDVAALDGGPNPASAAALAPAVLWVIPNESLRRLARAYPELSWALIESLARRARHLVSMVEDLALRSVRARLAKLLLAEAEASDAPALERSQMMTQSEMAARLGTVREMVGRALRAFADEGLIAFDRNRIVIVDRAGLEEAAEGG